MPELATGAGVDGPGVVGHGEVEHAIHFERRGFDGDAARRIGAHVDAVHPGESQCACVGSGHLLQRAEAATGVIAIVGGPGIGGQLFEFGGVKALG